MRLAITGHRPNKLGNDYNNTSPLLLSIRARLITEVMKSTNNPDDLVLITGMALGIDTLFAEVAIGIRLRFTAAIPCDGQELMWPIQAQLYYQKLINHPLCLQHYVNRGPYAAWKMQKRNEWMVNNCDTLIAVWDGSQGGTANCVKYAESINKPIIYIKPTI